MSAPRAADTTPGTTHVPLAFAEALASVSTAGHPDDVFPADLAAAAGGTRAGPAAPLGHRSPC